MMLYNIKYSTLKLLIERGIRERIKTKNFHRFDFECVDFEGVDFRGVDFRGACFRGACFRGTDFEGVDFKGACFRDADFESADFEGADFEGADFEGVDFRGVDFRYINGDGTLFVTLIVKYKVVIIKSLKKMLIGCQSHTFDKWKSFTDKEIICFDGKEGLKFWNNYKQILFSIIKKD